MFNFKLATALLIGTLAAGSYAAIHAASLDAEAASNLAQLAQVQQYAVAGDGLFAADLSSASNPLCAEDLSSVFGDTCKELSQLVEETTISYVVNAERTHYVLAERHDSGRVIVVSDTTPLGVACEDYDYSCIAIVTDDEQLRSATPVWVEQ